MTVDEKLQGFAQYVADHAQEIGVLCSDLNRLLKILEAQHNGAAALLHFTDTHQHHAACLDEFSTSGGTWVKNTRSNPNTHKPVNWDHPTALLAQAVYFVEKNIAPYYTVETDNTDHGVSWTIPNPPVYHPQPLHAVKQAFTQQGTEISDMRDIKYFRTMDQGATLDITPGGATLPALREELLAALEGLRPVWNKHLSAETFDVAINALKEKHAGALDALDQIGSRAMDIGSDLQSRWVTKTKNSPALKSDQKSAFL
jgi:hypothetical protein